MAQPVGPPVLPEPALSEAAAKRPLSERVRELEIGWAANENATRQIIRNSLSKTGPKINSFLSLSGVVEGVASRAGSFTGPTQENLSLGTAELDFDIKLSDWLTGALVLHFDNGTGAIFPTGNQPVVPTNLAGVGVDRFTLDRTHILGRRSDAIPDRRPVRGGDFAFRYVHGRGAPGYAIDRHSADNRGV